MPATVLARPAAADHHEYYSAYIARVPAGNLVEIMASQIATFSGLVARVPAGKAGHRYAPGKWSVREVVGHLTDTERVFSFRATAFSRADPSPLPSFDQAAWNPYGNYESRALDDLLSEWTDARRATVSLLRSMPEEALQRRGIASEFEFTVLALICIPPGHLEYHIAQLEDLYLR